MKLRFSPLQVFKSSKTPAGLYARQKWLGESATRQWKNDFQETVTKLMADQASDGSWQQSEVETIARLFGLHLTVREASAQIEAALKWLFGKIDLQSAKNQFDAKENIIKETPEGLPFICSRRGMFLMGAILFLASIFNRHDDPFVLDRYSWLSSVGIRNKGIWIDPASSHNVFRALVVHPIYSKDPATSLFVEYLADIQTESGDWGDYLPFYQIMNALAHLNFPLADNQLEKAFARLVKTQNEDGSWADTGSEWNTFLAVHALKNKGLYY
ncbi:MAG: hypothetical protein JSV31_22005 [Desulfobacterales bacterium]|nr:MAG: hypothetical protein JSV31_22005 [Desulfobacterales bacterium]